VKDINENGDKISNSIQRERDVFLTLSCYRILTHYFIPISV